MKSILIFITVSLLGAASCSKNHRVGPSVVPNSLLFQIKQNGVRLDDYTLDNIKLYYFKSGVKSYVPDLIRGTNEVPFMAHDLGVLGTRKIGNISGDENIKDFFLEYPNGDIDTLWVNYRYINDNEAFNNPCYCHYPLDGVKFNGVSSFPDSTITTLVMVYRFDKH